MLAIRKALENEFERVKKFYNELIDAMQDASINRGGKKESIRQMRIYWNPFAVVNCIWENWRDVSLRP